MNISVSARAVALLGSLTACPILAEPQPPGLPGSWKWVPEFSDEFNAGALDRKKWHPTFAAPPGGPPSVFREQNVLQVDGKLELHLKADAVKTRPDGHPAYTAAILRSGPRIRYGYFEIRARAAASSSASAFRFHHQEPERVTGIGVFEFFPAHPPSSRTAFTNATVLRYPGLDAPLQHPLEIALKEDPSTGFHIWAMHWDAATLTWFLDGKPVRTLANTHWKTPLRLVLETGAPTGQPDRASRSTAFIIDYIRSWQSTPP